MPQKTGNGKGSVESLTHKDKRVNIPTEELHEWVADDEKQPKSVLYPRDPTLDPQLVWKGKDELDQHPLEVPSVPIYIQEKILPQAIIEQVRSGANRTEPLPLFADYDGIADFETQVDFYRHEQNWTNRLVLGDSLKVMTSLAEKEGLKGKVQMIYLDPPYGIKFGSNWQISTKNREVRDGKAEYLTRQPEQIRAFRDTWKLGIHSYLTYLRDRLTVARELLTESGSIFVQIGDENVHLVRSVLDEVYGSANLVAGIAFKKTGGQSSNELASVFDHVLWYSRDRTNVKYRRLLQMKRPGEEGARQYNWIELSNGHRRPMTGGEADGRLPDGAVILQPYPMVSMEHSASDRPFRFQERNFVPSPNSHWKTTSEGLNRLAEAGRVIAIGNTLRFVNYLSDFPATPLTNLWVDTQTSGFAADRLYVVQTLTSVIERCLQMTTDAGDLVLDPTCGSGTTAFVAEQWGRRWISIDTSRVALAVARTRLMGARYPYYLLADSEEGVQKEAEVTGHAPSSPLPKTEHDVKKGFVYRRVPHVTLKSIANNPEIDLIYERWQEKLEPIRVELNQILGQEWEEWQVPREPEESWSSEAKTLLDLWWRYRRERQSEIDASIARHAETELLYDQPYQDNKRVRVTGPFTVESLSPHRVLSADEETDEPRSIRDAETFDTGRQFETVVIENLKTAGIQNTKKGERLTFERLEPYSGVYLQAEGSFQENGTTKRVAICIGPENGTVGPDLVKDAARETVGALEKFDLLIVCGLAFDPHVSEEAKRIGRLQVLITRVNPDLTMGGDLLKKTASANLFTVFGEPDIQPIDPRTGKIRPQKDGKIVVELTGVDVYDPTTGQIRSNSTDDIACWFIDTDYNEESFFVRHAYFTGANDPYERLKQALRAEIDPGAWSALYATKSLPFDRPSTGKIAVKVINHYGDEVLKVYGVG